MLLKEQEYFTEVSVVKYIEIANEQSNVVIDEQYNVPMLLARVTVSTTVSTYTPKIYPNQNDSEWMFNYAKFDWIGSVAVASWASAAEVPFELEGDVSTLVLLTEKLNSLALDMVTASRCLSGDYGVLSSVYAYHDKVANKVELRLSAECELRGGLVEVVVYAPSNVKPVNPTLAIFSETGKLVYDVRKPPMVYLGSVYGDLNLKWQIAGNFFYTIPVGIERKDVFMTSKAGAPYYSAYKIGAGGVSFASTPFKTVVSYPSATQINVQVIRVRNVSGTSGETFFGGFFENLIYCPYPPGLYI